MARLKKLPPQPFVLSLAFSFAYYKNLFAKMEISQYFGAKILASWQLMPLIIVDLFNF